MFVIYLYIRMDEEGVIDDCATPSLPLLVAVPISPSFSLPKIARRSLLGDFFYCNRPVKPPYNSDIQRTES